MYDLTTAVRENNIPRVKALIAQGTNVNYVTWDTTALIAAVETGNAEAINLLLAAGAEVDKKAKMGLTAVLHAAAKSPTDILELLLAKKPDLNLQDDNGRTALILAVDSPTLFRSEKVRILIQAGAKLNLQNIQGVTALMRASGNGSTEIVRALIDAGADVKRKDSFKKTALVYAKEKKHLEIIRLLKAAGAKE